MKIEEHDKDLVVGQLLKLRSCVLAATHKPQFPAPTTSQQEHDKDMMEGKLPCYPEPTPICKHYHSSNNPYVVTTLEIPMSGITTNLI